MKGRILALGALLVLTASTVDAQSRRGGSGKGKATSDSARQHDASAHRGHAQGSAEDRRRSGAPDEYGRKFGTARGYGMLLNGIQLTDAQKAQIKGIRESYRPRYQALRDTSITLRKDNVQTAADTAVRARHRALMQAERAEIRAVLTSEQQPRFDANVKRLEDRIAKQGSGANRTKGKGGASSA